MKPIEFLGDSLDCLREFPKRVLYVAKFADAVYVLHCFQKKAQATPKRDIDLARKRYSELLEEQR